MGSLDCRHERGGVWLPALGLRLDPTQPCRGPERVFVSHAHSDHTARHREVILTEATGLLMQARLPGPRIEHRLPWNTTTRFDHDGGTWSITLLPAGHILGSAMALLDCGGATLLYTGDFKLRTGLSAEPCQPAHADILIMETTFGRPNYRFPPADEVLADVTRFCRETLDQGRVPVLFGYSLGKSQETLLALARAGLPFAVHPRIARISQVYQQAGQSLPAPTVVTPETARGRVVVCPPGTRLDGFIDPALPLRKAVLTGWALDRGCAYRYRVDAAFPLSDHADFDELEAFVCRVAPRTVLTVHGFAADFAAHLRELGFDARTLHGPEQLTLDLGRTRRRGGSPSSLLPGSPDRGRV